MRDAAEIRAADAAQKAEQFLAETHRRAAAAQLQIEKYRAVVAAADTQAARDAAAAELAALEAKVEFQRIESQRLTDEFDILVVAAILAEL
jgi:hypothetical protein